MALPGQITATVSRGFPGGAICKESACQCRRCKRCRFNPWVRKIPWRRNWQSIPVFLPGKFHGQRSLARYSSWSHKKSDTTEHCTTPGKYLEKSKKYKPLRKKKKKKSRFLISCFGYLEDRLVKRYNEKKREIKLIKMVLSKESIINFTLGYWIFLSYV